MYDLCVVQIQGFGNSIIEQSGPYHQTLFFALLFCPFWPNFFTLFHSYFFLFLCSIFFMHHSHSQQHNKDTIWLALVHQATYSQHQLLDCHMITWLQSPWNSPSPIQPLDLVLELPPWPSPLPTAQSSGLPEPGTQGVVCSLCECLGLLKGSSELLQQDCPNLEPPFIKPLPQTLQGNHRLQLEQGRSLHHPPASQWHRPTEPL